MWVPTGWVGSVFAGWWWVGVCTVVLYVGIWLDTGHMLRMCEPCMASWPLDGAAAAVARAARLREYHRQRPLLVGSMFLMGGAAAFVAATDTVPLVSTFATLLFSVVWWRQVRATRLHRALQPWCPVCGNRGGGGEEVKAPDPVPTGRGVR